MVIELRDNEKDVIASLDGTILRVFLYTLKNKDNIGIRETQKKLGFKNASLAQYHLQRLYTMGILEKNPNNTYKLADRYASLRSIKIGLLSEIYIFRGCLIPLMGIIAGLLLGSIPIAIILFLIVSPVTAIVFTLMIIAITTAILIYQTVLAYISLRR